MPGSAGSTHRVRGRLGLRVMGLAALLSASLLFAGCMPMVQRLADNPPVTGQVLDAHTGEPIAGARVQVMPRDLAPGPTTYSDQQGYFSLPEQDRLRLFLALPGTALEHVPVVAEEVNDDATLPQRVGFGSATKWLRQPAPATERRIVILMLPPAPGVMGDDQADVITASSCESLSQSGYTLQILDILPTLLQRDWFRRQLVDDAEAGYRHLETLDHFASVAGRECRLPPPVSAAHREVLRDYWHSLMAGGPGH